MINKKLTNKQAIGVLDSLWPNPLFGEAHRQAFKIGIKGIKALEQEPCEDAISRQAVISTIYDNKSDFKNDFSQGFFADRIRELSPVNPQPKTGYWIVHEIESTLKWLECSNCHCETSYNIMHNYCPNCGAKMEVSE